MSSTGIKQPSAIRSRPRYSTRQRRRRIRKVALSILAVVAAATLTGLLIPSCSNNQGPSPDLLEPENQVQ
jgi:hypothetical protein